MANLFSYILKQLSIIFEEDDSRLLFERILLGINNSQSRRGLLVWTAGQVAVFTPSA
jgi:hypothetical protein